MELVCIHASGRMVTEWLDESRPRETTKSWPSERASRLAGADSVVHGLRARGLRAAGRPPAAGDAMSAALELAGVVKRYGARRGAGRRRPRRRTAGACSRCSGPTARASRTLVSIAAGLLAPDAGTSRARRRPGGARPRDAPQIGLAPQEIGIYPSLTRAREPVGVRRAARRARGARERAAGCSSRSCSASWPTGRPGGLSGGEQRRLHAAIALVQPAAAGAARRADRGRGHATREPSCRPSATSPPRARRSSTRRTTCPRSRRSTPTSRCSSTAGSSRAGRSPSSSRGTPREVAADGRVRRAARAPSLETVDLALTGRSTRRAPTSR